MLSCLAKAWTDPMTCQPGAASDSHVVVSSSQTAPTVSNADHTTCSLACPSEGFPVLLAASAMHAFRWAAQAHSAKSACCAKRGDPMQGCSNVFAMFIRRSPKFTGNQGPGKQLAVLVVSRARTGTRSLRQAFLLWPLGRHCSAS